VLLVGTSRIVVGVFADANARLAKDAGRLRVHQVRLKPALRLFEMSPVGVSLTEPVTLNGPPNSFCSALSVRSHLSSMLEMSAPTDKRYRMGGEQKVTVQHVTVNEGGQAIVGNVRHGGRASPKNPEATP
jgi:hypothetical protein